MTSQSPRIYTYKITFEEVPYYYYGSHKEKKFNEEYWGSPKTNKWCWEFYTPKKQILEFFEFTDEGWLECLNVEGKLISYFYNNDKFCLNKCCNGRISLDILRKNGKILGNYVKKNKLGIFNLSFEEKSEISKKVVKKLKENKLGIFSLTSEEIVENAKKGGKAAKDKSVGIFGMTPEEKSESGRKGGTKSGNYNKENGIGICGLSHDQRSENGKKSGKIGGKIGGKRTYENRTGLFSMTPEQKINACKKGAKKAKENGLGIFALTTDELRENGRKSGNYAKENKLGIFSLTKEQKQEIIRKTNSQRWQCTETGYISSPAGLSHYQRAKGIDTSNRIKIG